MTGYGEGKCELDGIAIYIRLSTLNHRYRDIQFNCSEEIPYRWEQALVNLLKKQIARSKVLVDIRITRKRAPYYSAEVNKELLSHYFTTLNALNRELGATTPLSVSDLLGLPGVTFVEKREDSEVEALILKTFKDALRELMIHRHREGTHHLTAIRTSIDYIRAGISHLKKEIPAIRRHQQTRLRRQLQHIHPNHDRTGISKEVATLLNRSDVNEELIRLTAHLQQLDRALRLRGPMGKRLVFILQEMNRETNTIGSKINSPTISETLIGIKEALERIRELAQNIE